MIRHGIRLDIAKRTISLVAPSQVSPSVPQSSPAVLQAASSRRGSPCTYPNNIVLLSQTMWTPSPNRETPTSSSAPSIAEVPRTESIRAVVVGPYDEDPTTLPEYQPTEPQFIEPLDTDEYEKETKELLSQVPSQHHEYLDIFRKKGGTETLPPPRPYDMRIDLLPSAKLAVAKLYQLTEDQRMILLDTLKRETEAGRIRPSNAAYGSPMFFVPKKDGRSRMVVDYRRLVQRLQVHHTPLQHPLHRRIPTTHRRQRFESSYYSDKARSTSYNHVSRAFGQERSSRMDSRPKKGTRPEEVIRLRGRFAMEKEPTVTDNIAEHRRNCHDRELKLG